MNHNDKFNSIDSSDHSRRRSRKRLALAATAPLVAGLGALAVARPAAADMVSPWGGYATTVVHCSPYSHTMTTSVTITPDADKPLQGVGWIRYIDRWNGSTWVATYVDSGDMWASSVPTVTTTRPISAGYYRVRMSYYWSTGQQQSTFRASGSETIPAYIQHGSTGSTANNMSIVASYCAV
jgi:hypothetical protein